jgi:hypothetical protein
MSNAQLLLSLSLLLLRSCRGSFAGFSTNASDNITKLAHEIERNIRGMRAIDRTIATGWRDESIDQSQRRVEVWINQKEQEWLASLEAQRKCQNPWIFFERILQFGGGGGVVVDDDDEEIRKNIIEKRSH